MRKLFSILSAVLVSLAMQAAQVTQNVWGGSLALTNAEFQPHNETLFEVGQTLRLTFVNNSGWMQVFHKNGAASNWPSTNLVNGLDLSRGSVEVVLTSTAVSEIQNYGGLYIKGENITLKSIDLIYDDGVAPEMDATTIWTGNLTAGVDEESAETTIEASAFASAKAGDKVRFTFSNVEGASYYQMNAITKDNNWNTSHTYMSYTGVTAPSVEITLVEEGLEDLKARGLFFKGKNVTITKAELLQPAWVTATIWTGNLTAGVDEESAETTIEASAFASAKAGDKVRFTFSNVEGASYYQMNAITKDNNWNTSHTYMSYTGVTAPSVEITLVEEGLEDLKARGLFFKGKNVTITKAELLRLKVSSDEQAAVVSDEQDPTALLESLNGETVDFTLNRTLYCDGYYNTLCLPFSLASLENTPLANAEVVTLVDAGITGTKEGGDMVLNIEIEQVSAIEAGKPYLVSFPSGNDLTSMTFADVTISATEPQTIHTTLLDMVGILAPTEMAADTDSQLFLGANNTLYWSDGSAPLKGYRAYFRTNSVSVPAGMPARIVKHENTTTAISNVLDEQHAQKILRDGQLVIIRDGKQYNALGAIIK